MSDDIWGGIFDLDGDGKTTWDEEMIAFDIIEESRKNNSKHRISPSPRTPKGHKDLPTIEPVPEVVNATNYATLLNMYRTECILSVIALVLMLFPAIAILWAVYDTYDPDSAFLSAILTLAGCYYIGIALFSTAKSIKTGLECIAELKRKYCESKEAEK